MRNFFKGNRNIKVYFIDASICGLWLARFMLLFFGLKLNELKFRLVDVHDDDGVLLHLRVDYFDSTVVQKYILERPIFSELFLNKPAKSRIAMFLAKRIFASASKPESTLDRAVYLIQVVKQKSKEYVAECLQPVLFLDRRLWMNEIKRYACKHNISVIGAKSFNINFKYFLLGFLGPKINILKNIYFWFLRIKRSFCSKYGWIVKNKKSISIVIRHKKNNADNSIIGSQVKLGVNYYGHLNLNNPELYSDLFFLQQSDLSGKDILIVSNMLFDPIDDKKLMEIAKHDMNVVALSAKATNSFSVPFFYHWPSRSSNSSFKFISKNAYNGDERRWFLRQMRDYYKDCNYWQDFFAKHNVKAFMTWYKYDASHCVVADAMRNVGGIMAVYQRAFEEFPSCKTTIASDVVFGFSPANAEIERLSGSQISYHISTGYYADYRLPLLKAHAQRVRTSLQQRGAKQIIAYFDENSGADSRWHNGHESTIANYDFLLKKVLSQKWFGLILKPKVPSTLRLRLGLTADLLKEAEATGRCFVFEAGALHSAYPPAIAALASDIAIHGHLYAATAGLESALAGVPTLLLDREGWSISKLYHLGLGRVVFTDWQSLWKTYIEYWQDSRKVPGFGDWSSMINDLDPFRDGRAAERIGTYLKWLLDGFKQGLKREDIMASAAERYARIWGSDKIATLG
ncbi:MAG: hypothetical protein K9L86_02890 [Candidatus Omnitrophica bacterium]|nr:hypothetical protein [Candidatus Omnitrophota bacterium]